MQKKKKKRKQSCSREAGPSAIMFPDLSDKQISMNILSSQQKAGLPFC
jgi:hypothetical protein